MLFKTAVQHPDILKVFVLGRPIVDRLQVEIDIGIESRRYGDILLVDFDDTYRNLSLKSLAILRWSQHYCTSATFIFQGDSDAIVFPRQVHAFVQQLSIDNDQQQPARIYGGWCWNIARVQRYGKWYDDDRFSCRLFILFAGNSNNGSMHLLIIHCTVRVLH